MKSLTYEFFKNNKFNAVILHLILDFLSGRKEYWKKKYNRTVSSMQMLLKPDDPTSIMLFFYFVKFHLLFKNKNLYI